MNLNLMATLLPSFVHFADFANDTRLSGLRLNSAMSDRSEIANELRLVGKYSSTIPLWFDAKGRQLRIAEVHPNPNYLDITLNHPISVQTPVPVLFKAGADGAHLKRVEENGYRLIFHGGPRYTVRAGESLHIRHPSFRSLGPTFASAEIEKLEVVRSAGLNKYFLSYVENQRDIDQFLELVGPDSEVQLKIENQAGLDFVAQDFKKTDNLRLVAARGDLYVEVNRPHEIMAALKLIIFKDPEACVGSRLLLSVVQDPVPSCADFLELAWLYDVGYRNMLLCDELCLKGDLLNTAICAFDAFRGEYASSQPRTLAPLHKPAGFRGFVNKLIKAVS